MQITQVTALKVKYQFMDCFNKDKVTVSDETIVTDTKSLKRPIQIKTGLLTLKICQTNSMYTINNYIKIRE